MLQLKWFLESHSKDLTCLLPLTRSGYFYRFSCWLFRTWITNEINGLRGLRTIMLSAYRRGCAGDGKTFHLSRCGIKLWSWSTLLHSRSEGSFDFCNITNCQEKSQQSETAANDWFDWKFREILVNNEKGVHNSWTLLNAVRKAVRVQVQCTPQNIGFIICVRRVSAFNNSAFHSPLFFPPNHFENHFQFHCLECIVNAKC